MNMYLYRLVHYHELVADVDMDMDMEMDKDWTIIYHVESCLHP